MVRCVSLVLEDLLYLCPRMTMDEQDQYAALSGESYDHRKAALHFANLGGVSFTLLDSADMPVCAGGYHEVAPGVWQSWMAGTEGGWVHHWRAITKHSRRVMDQLFQHGARRLQTNALASRTLARKWYEVGLKMQHEGTMRGFAANGDDVVIYARLRRAS